MPPRPLSSPRTLRLWAIAFACASISLPAAAQTAAAAYPGANGALLVSSHFGCDGSQIQLLSAAGALSALTPSPCSAEGEGALAMGASFSADGRTVVFLQGSRLAAMRADGADARLLPVAPASCCAGQRPSLSPDGRHVLFTRAGAVPGHPSVWLARVDGTLQRRLRAGSGARWSPDGRTIAFVGPTHDARGRPLRTAGGVLLMRRDGSAVRRLTRAGAGVDWSPDGRHLVFSRETSTRAGRPHTDLFSIRRDGRLGRRLTATRDTSEHAPVWSPDGRRIAFVRSARAGEEDAPRESIRTIARRGGPSALRLRLPASSELGSAPAPTTLDWQPR